MDEVRLATLVGAVLEPALPVGLFGAAQTYVSDEHRGRRPVAEELATWPAEAAYVLWCSAHRDLERLYPDLPQAEYPGGAPDGACDDLIIEFDADGHVTRAT